MTKDDKVFGTMTHLIFKVTLKKTAKLRQKLSNLRVGRCFIVYQVYEQLNRRLSHVNFDFNFNVDAEKTVLNLVQIIR